MTQVSPFPAKSSIRLYRHFSRMTDAVRAHRGVADKYIGDSVRAFRAGCARLLFKRIGDGAKQGALYPGSERIEPPSTPLQRIRKFKLRPTRKRARLIMWLRSCTLQDENCGGCREARRRDLPARHHPPAGHRPKASDLLRSTASDLTQI